MNPRPEKPILQVEPQNESLSMFEFNPQKAIEAILYFAEKEKHVNRKDIDLIKINKYCYFSEKYHLQKYLRPIFGDTYSALPEGPVPSMIYDILKWLRGDMNAYMRRVLKTVAISEEIPLRPYPPHFVAPLRKADTKVFAKSEIEAMDRSFEQYCAYPSMKLSELSHDEPAWKKASSCSRNEMDFEEIIGDKEAWNYIKEHELESQVFRASFQH